MHVLQAGLDEKTVQFLAADRITTHMAEDAESVEDVCEWVRDGLYEAVVIDLDSTGWGPYLARQFRSKRLDIPIVGIIRVNGETPWTEQRAVFLENGGDDLIRGPANPRELAASLRAVTRRFKGSAVDVLSFTAGAATLKIDRAGGIASVNDAAVHLTGKEFQLLEILAVGAGRVQSKEAILTNLYTTTEDEAEMKIIDVFVCKLRHKLAAQHGDAGGLIDTVWGRGYRLNASRSNIAGIESRAA
jgi:two-component system cell cycle response regulator CtrA